MTLLFPFSVPFVHCLKQLGQMCPQSVIPVVLVRVNHDVFGTLIE